MLQVVNINTCVGPVGTSEIVDINIFARLSITEYIVAHALLKVVFLFSPMIVLYALLYILTYRSV